ATAPEIMPSTDGLRRIDHSIAPQVSAPAQAARWVAMIAITAREFAARADPPLKPNQPTHSSPVPITASDKSNGDRFSVPYPWRWPITLAATRPPTPALSY